MNDVIQRRESNEVIARLKISSFLSPSGLSNRRHYSQLVSYVKNLKLTRIQ